MLVEKEADWVEFGLIAIGEKFVIWMGLAISKVSGLVLTRGYSIRVMVVSGNNPKLIDKDLKLKWEDEVTMLRVWG